MFSDTLVPLKVLGSLIILILLGTYSHQYGKTKDEKALKLILACVTSPTTCTDQPLVIRIRTGDWSKTLAMGEVKAGKNYLSEHPIKIAGLTGRKSAGRIIDLLGSFDRNSVFTTVRQREDDWVQATKYIVSLAGLGLCLWLFARLYSLSPGWRLPLIARQDV